MLLAVVLLQLCSYGLKYWPYSFLPNLAPTNPGALQGTLWVVIAALVGVSLPVFIVVIQFAGSASEDIAALPLTEVLRRKTRADLTFLVAGLAVVHCGADALWFHGGAVLVFDYFVALVAMVVVLGFSYWALYNVIRSRVDLKEAGIRLLEEKLDKAIDDSWIRTEANSNLIEQLADHGVTYSPWDIFSNTSDWIRIAPAQKHMVKDVDAKGLAAFADWLTSTNPNQEPDTPSEDQAGNDQRGNLSDLVLLRVCWSPIGPTSPLLALRVANYPSQTAGELWLAVEGYVEMEIDDG